MSPGFRERFVRRHRPDKAVPKRIDAARRWYQRAADAGDSDAVNNLRILDSELEE